MGRKKKFGEESDFVSVRVPKSKRKEYRNAIKDFVDDKFAHESSSNNNDDIQGANKKELNGFRKFKEFIKEVKRSAKDEEGDT